jgi:hypothetical protein
MKTRPVICVAPADLTSPHLNDAPVDQTALASRAAALAEMDAWAERALQMPLFTEPPAQNIPNDVRANYVAYLRISIAIQELEKVMVIDAVQHPKKNELVSALKVWANRAKKAAEPNGTPTYGTE